ncbi:hypothetical protein [Insolitispirillum peregrinum]|uniref:hypothetical protein n=1 Tax=Insolitispirillum peregrinum TaxID=80876 RepID=UPI00360CCC74
MTLHTAPSPSTPCRLGERIQDVLWLMTLGAAWRGLESGEPITGSQILQAARVPSLSCSPCPDVIVACLEEMLRCDCLIGDPCQGLTITGQGKEVFARLMGEPAASLRIGAGRLAVRVRLAFLDLLDGEARCAALDALIAAAEDDLALLSTGLNESAWSGPFGGSWAVRDMASASQDLRTLGSLRSLLATVAA